MRGYSRPFEPNAEMVEETVLPQQAIRESKSVDEAGQNFYHRRSYNKLHRVEVCCLFNAFHADEVSGLSLANRNSQQLPDFRMKQAPICA